ncbi:restriction endonuclease subunit S [Flavobacterium microcysteis]|uniref:Restriction endonuclease subunit S n=1 Tax=Flavobacterium microcysteis TaxID=2596891 RepID=A0A501QEM3_9FLAO|nr:restriction endonuclease subunit S [Flavobacterium microcysteis]TPD71280.1 restriction endonuclease subunit S [Flavobacterium microcysteis]
MSEVNLSELEFSKRVDAEYYQKHFLKYEKLIQSKGNFKLNDVANFLIGPFGSSFIVDNYTNDETYRYIRGKDVKPLKLMEDDNVYMPKDDYDRLSRYALKKDDVLVSVVGTLGNAAIVSERNLPAIFSCKSTVVRSSINPKYLLAYLNSKYGRMLLLRKERGAIQKGLNLDDLKLLDLFIPSDNFQNLISNLFNLSDTKLLQSQHTYAQAEQMLLEAVGLQNFVPSQEAVNVKTFKESFLQSGRLDAEYYQPKYEEIIAKIKQSDYLQISQLVTIKKSIEPGSSSYQEEGIPFIRVSNLSKYGISNPEIHLDKNEFSEVIKPKKDTILLSKDGSVGIAYKVSEDLQSITSSAILHLTVDNPKVNADYLTLVLNSKLVQLQAERDAGGSIIQHWKPSEIAEVIIPILDPKTQTQIATWVQESFSLKQQSEQLLYIAKRAVEIAIEENEEVAMAYITPNN